MLPYITHAGPPLCTTLPRTISKLEPQQQQQQKLFADTTAADAVKPLDQSPAGNQTHQAVVQIITDPTAADAAAGAAAAGCSSSSECDDSSSGGVEAGSGPVKQQQLLLDGPGLCPGVSLGSWCCQAWLKALIIGAAYAGETMQLSQHVRVMRWL
jgi:hypothetical protein